MQLLYKTVRIFLFVFLGILILLAVAGFLAEPVVKRILLNKVSEAGKGQYALSLQELNLSLLKGDVVLKGIQLTSDSSKVEKGPLVQAEIEELSVEGFSWLSYFLEEKLLVDKLSLSQANVALKLFNEKQNDPPKELFQLDQMDLYPALQGEMEKIHLEDLSLDQLQFSLINVSTGDTFRFSTGHLDLHSQDILVDANKVFNDSRAFYASRIDLDGHQLNLSRSGSEEWVARAAKLNFDTRQDKMDVSADELHFLQTAREKQDTLMFFDLQELKMQELDLQELENTKTAVLSSLALNGLELNLPDTATGTTEPFGSLASFSLGKQLPPFVQQIELEGLDINKVSIRRGKEFHLKGLSLKAREIIVDEEPAFSANRFMHASSMESEVGELTLIAGEPAHKLLLYNFSLQAENGIGSIKMEKVSSKPLEKRGNNSWLDAEIENFSLLSINTRNLPSGELFIDSLLVKQPQLVLFMAQQAGSNAGSAETAFSIKDLDIYPAMSKQLEKLQIDGLALEQLQLDMISAGSKNPISLSLRRLDLHSQDILIEAGNILSDSRAFYAGRTELEGHQLAISGSGSEEWMARAGKLSFNTRQDKMGLSAANLHFLQKATEKQDTLMLFDLQEVDMQELDLHKLENTKTATLSSLALKNLGIKLAETDQSEKAGSPSKPLSDFSLAEGLPAFVQKLSMGELDVQGLNLKQEKGLKIKIASLIADGILVDKASAFAENRFLHALRLEAEAEELELAMGEPTHEILLNGFSLIAADGKAHWSLERLLTFPQQEWEDKAWLEAEVEGLGVLSIDTRKLPAGELAIDSLILEQPEMVFYQPQSDSETKNKQEDRSPIDLYPLIEGKLKSLKLNKLAVLDGDIRLGGLGSYYGLHIPDLEVEVNDFLLNSSTAQAPKRVLHAGDIELRARRLMYIFPDRVYTLQLDEGLISTADKSLEMQGFRYGYSENYKEILEGPETNEVYLILNPKIKVEGIDWDKLFREKTLEADKLLSEGLDVYVYKDFNVPESGKVKPMPQDMVLNTGFPMALEQIIIRDAKVTYEEMKEGAGVAGRVNLKEMNVELENVTNIKQKLQKRPQMFVNASGELLGRGFFKSQIQVPLLHEDMPVKVSGSMDTLDITALNRIVRYNSRLAIESGILYQLNWDFEAGREVAEGTLQLSYENLRVQLSEVDSPDTTGLLKDVGSFLANVLVVDSNIAEERSVEPKKVYFEQERKKNRSFFHYYVLALMGGFIEALEIPFQ